MHTLIRRPSLVINFLVCSGCCCSDVFIWKSEAFEFWSSDLCNWSIWWTPPPPPAPRRPSHWWKPLNQNQPFSFCGTFGWMNVKKRRLESHVPWSSWRILLPLVKLAPLCFLTPRNVFVFSDPVAVWKEVGRKRLFTDDTVSVPPAYSLFTLYLSLLTLRPWMEVSVRVIKNMP